MTHSMQHYALTVDKFLEHAAKWHGTQEVISAHGLDSRTTRTTYAELRQGCIRLSGGLLDQGLEAGDCIATLAWNTKHHLSMYYSAMAAGLVCHTLNPRLTVQQLTAMVNEAADRWIAVGAGLQPLLKQLLSFCPTIEGIILLDDQREEISVSTPRGCWTLAAFLEQFGRAAKWGQFGEDAPAGLCYTSGTVGNPRGVLYTHRSNYLHTLRILQADAAALTARDVVLIAVPMFHANGWGLPFAAPAVGAKVVLPGRSSDAAHLKNLIMQEGVTVSAAVPTVWLGLLKLIETEGGDLPSLERIIVGGSHCPEALITHLEDRLGVKVQTSWGMTELSPMGTISPPWEGACGSGRSPMGLDLKFVDPQGNVVEPGTMVAGRLWVRGASVAERYYKEEANLVDSEGYLDTGDLGFVDRSGNLFIAGRSKDLIKSGGEWINPAEIEKIVACHPAVSLTAVVGVLDLKWGERPVLVVEPSGKQVIDEHILLDALIGKIPNWWIPDRVVVVERMPLAATGKIDKKRLREQIAGITHGTDALPG